jgi:predicted membrane protein
MATPLAPDEPSSPGLRWPSLLVGLVLMVVLTVYPPLLTNAKGQADHALAGVMLLAMSTGLVSGVGFVPRWWGWRWLFSGWTCAASLALAAWLVLGR